MARKILSWSLAPAPGSTDHVKINPQYERYQRQWQKLKSLPGR